MVGVAGSDHYEGGRQPTTSWTSVWSKTNASMVQEEEEVGHTWVRLSTIGNMHARAERNASRDIDASRRRDETMNTAHLLGPTKTPCFNPARKT